LLLIINVRNNGEGRSKYLYGSLYLSDLISILLRFRTHHLLGLRDERRRLLDPLVCLLVKRTLLLFLLLLLFCHLFQLLTQRHLIPLHELFLLADSLPDLLLHLQGLLDLRVLPVDEASVGPFEFGQLLCVGAV
jgi:hypothetical protein